MKFDLKKYSKLPGVYLMKNHQGEVLYIGKANNLQARLKQYFGKYKDTRPQIPLLIAQVESLETILVNSEKEALLLEHTLIKKHSPKYNFLLKDDKSYACLQISNDQWPELKMVRAKDAKANPDLFGPYPSSFAARKMLHLLQRLFPLRECSNNVLKNRTRPCILYEIKRCIAPCVNKCSKQEYQDYVMQLRQFLKGNDKTVIKDLTKKMKEASKNLEYEKAAQYLTTIRQIEALLEKQNVTTYSNIDSDVIGLYREGDNATLSLLTYKMGNLINSFSYPMPHDIEEDEELISSFIFQNYTEAKDFPHEILCPTLPSDFKVLSELISLNSPHKIKLWSPSKGSKKVTLQIAFNNAKDAFNKEIKKSAPKEKLLFELKDKLQLENYPETIECFDNSHLSGTTPVSAMISFVNGHYEKSRLRKYHLDTTQVFDDLKGMEEVLLRRYKKQELSYPDLIIVDGGKTQLNIAKQVLSKLGIIHIDLIALTKEASRHDFGSTQEKIYVHNQSQPIILPRNSNLLFFLQTIRDQAHRAAITFQRKSRQKNTLTSVLDDIPGIGAKKKKALIEHFKSPQKVTEANKKELQQVKALNQRDIEAILTFFKHTTK